MADLEIQWAELVAAVLGARGRGKCFFDRRDGRVVTRAGGDHQDPHPDGRPQVGDNGHLLELPRLGPRDGYEDMRRFIATVASPPLRDRLQRSVQGPGAFRRFRDTLAQHPRELQRWLAFRGRAVQERLARWLGEQGVEGFGTAEAEPAEQPPSTVPTTLEELTLLVLYLGSWVEDRGQRGVVRRTWKGYRFEVLNQLEEAGLLTQGRSSKSIFLTPEGSARALEIHARVNGAASPAANRSAADGRPRPRRRPGPPTRR
jgi:hypothetical protein